MPFDGGGCAVTRRSTCLEGAGRCGRPRTTLGHVGVAPLARAVPRRRGRPAIARRAAAGRLPEHPPAGSAGQRRGPAGCAASATSAATSGAKNTLDHTYLSAASHDGAAIHVHTEVRGLARRARRRLRRRGRRPRPRARGRPDADACRSTRSWRAGSSWRAGDVRQHLPAAASTATGSGSATPALGTRFCGNGDLLGFLLHTTADGPRGHARAGDHLVRSGHAGEVDDRRRRAITGCTSRTPATRLSPPGWPSRPRAPAGSGGSRPGRRGAAARGSRASGAPTCPPTSSRVLGDGPVQQQRPAAARRWGCDVPDGTLYLRDPDTDRCSTRTWTTRTSHAYFDDGGRPDGGTGARPSTAEFVVNPLVPAPSGRSPCTRWAGCRWATSERGRRRRRRTGRVYGVPGLLGRATARCSRGRSGRTRRSRSPRSPTGWPTRPAREIAEAGRMNGGVHRGDGRARRVRRTRL